MTTPTMNTNRRPPTISTGKSLPLPVTDVLSPVEKSKKKYKVWEKWSYLGYSLRTNYIPSDLLPFLLDGTPNLALICEEDMLSFDMFPESWYCLNSDADLWSSLIVDVGQIFVGWTDTFTAQITAGNFLNQTGRGTNNDRAMTRQNRMRNIELTLT